MKNWIVISKPIKDQGKGLAKYLSYLTSSSHKNHKDKTRIIPLFGNNQNLYKRVIYSVADKELKTAKKRKGGRPISSYAQSFVFTLPEGVNISPTKSEWAYIAKEIISTLVQYTDTSKEELAKHIFINIHNQKNPHLNVVVSKIINGNVKTELQKKSIVAALKKTFNYAVLNKLHISPTDYQPQTKRAKRYNTDYYDKNREFIKEMTINEHYSKSVTPVCVHTLKPKKHTVKKRLRP